MLKSVVLQLQTLGKSEVKEKKGKNQAIARQLNNRKCLFLLLGLSFLSFSLCISLSAGAVWAAPFRLLRSTFFLVFAFKRLSSSFLSQSFPVESRISVSFLFYSPSFSLSLPPSFSDGMVQLASRFLSRRMASCSAHRGRKSDKSTAL